MGSPPLLSRSQLSHHLAFLLPELQVGTDQCPLILQAHFLGGVPSTHPQVTSSQPQTQGQSCGALPQGMGGFASWSLNP